MVQDQVMRFACMHERRFCFPLLLLISCQTIVFLPIYDNLYPDRYTATYRYPMHVVKYLLTCLDEAKPSLSPYATSQTDSHHIPHVSTPSASLVRPWSTIPLPRSFPSPHMLQSNQTAVRRFSHVRERSYPVVDGDVRRDGGERSNTSAHGKDRDVQEDQKQEGARKRPKKSQLGAEDYHTKRERQKIARDLDKSSRLSTPSTSPQEEQRLRAAREKWNRSLETNPDGKRGLRKKNPSRKEIRKAAAEAKKVMKKDAKQKSAQEALDLLQQKYGQDLSTLDDAIDKDWERLEATRIAQEQIILDFIQKWETDPGSLTPFIERHELLNDPSYAEYSRQISAAVHNPTEMGSRADAQRASNTLLKIHPEMDRRFAALHVIRDMAATRPKTKIPPPPVLKASILPDHVLPTYLIQQHIDSLTTRLAIEEAHPPHLQNGKMEFATWKAKLEGKGFGDVDRGLSRAMWKRNNTVAVAMQKKGGKGQEKGEMMSFVWRAMVHEIKSTLNTFKRHVVFDMEDEVERRGMLEVLGEEWTRLEAEGEVLAREKESLFKGVGGSKKGTEEWEGEAFVDKMGEEERELLDELLEEEEDDFADRELLKGILKDERLEREKLGKSALGEDFEGEGLDDEALEGDLERPGRGTLGETTAASDAPTVPLKDPIVEARVSHLREISHSIQSMKTTAAQDQQNASKLVRSKVEDMLRELEDEIGDATNRRANPYLEAKNDPTETTGIHVRSSTTNPNTPQAPTQSQDPKSASVSNESNIPSSLPTWPTPHATPSPRSLTEQLRAQLSARGKLKIDDTLIIDIEAPAPSLRTQIQQLSEKLKKEFPLMDTLPYDVWTSERRKTLQIWLRILVWKWQMRHETVSENAGDTPRPNEGVSLDVRALLEQNILEHGLNKTGAERMVKRWAQVFGRREERKMGVEQGEIEEVGDLDWEMDPGLGWLRDEGEVVDEERKNVKAVPARTEYEIPPDLPFSWKANRGTGYRSGANSVARRAAAGDEHVGGKRSFSTSTRWLGEGEGSDSELMRLVRNAQHQGSGPVIEEAENAAEDPFSNGEIADLLAAVAHTPQTQVPLRKEAEATREQSTKASTNAPPPAQEHPTKPTTSAPPPAQEQSTNATTTQPSLPHLTPTGTAHMVSITSKPPTLRTAIATATISFSNPHPLPLILSASLKKGDVLSVSRIAAIMAAKQTPTLIPLCHPIALTHVGVELYLFEEGYGGVVVESKVMCEGSTGVEMEALTSVVGGALSVVDMCKGVDRGIVIGGVRVVLKEGGRSGVWREEGWRSRGEGEGSK